MKIQISKSNRFKSKVQSSNAKSNPKFKVQKIFGFWILSFQPEADCPLDKICHLDFVI